MEEKNKKKACWICGRDEMKLKKDIPQLSLFDFEDYWFNYNPKILEDFMDTLESRKKGYF